MSTALPTNMGWHNSKSSAVESNFIFKNPQILHYTPVNSPSATDTKDGSECESVQSLEFRIIALDWIVLLRNMIREKNLTECEGNILEECHALQFGRHVYFTALRYSLSNEIKRFRMLQDCHWHRGWLRKIHKYQIWNNPSLFKEGDWCGRKYRKMDRQNDEKSRFSLFSLPSYTWIENLQRGCDNIPFLQAALLSGQNTYTRSPLASTPTLYSDSQNSILKLKFSNSAFYGAQSKWKKQARNNRLLSHLFPVAIIRTYIYRRLIRLHG